MNGDAIPDEAPASSDADGEPPSSGELRIIDRRAPGSAAGDVPVDLDALAGLAAKLVAALDRELDVSVALLDDVEMDRLHLIHCGIAGTTDVLSFPEDSGAAPEDQSVGTVAGDLAVGVEVAAREAASRGRTIEAELMVYIVHGVLHLLGERDHDRACAARMVVRQDRLLEALGLPATDEPRSAGIPESTESRP